MTLEIHAIEIVLEVQPAPQVLEIPGGLPGRSAYELARGQGYAGTLTEWLQSLQAIPNFLLRLSEDESALHFYTPAGVYLGSTYLINLGQANIDP